MACQSDETLPADGVAVNATGEAARPPLLAMNAFYYYDDVDRAWAFYTEILGLRTVVDYGFAKILRVAESSYLTLVDAAGTVLHRTEDLSPFLRRKDHRDCRRVLDKLGRWFLRQYDVRHAAAMIHHAHDLAQGRVVCGQEASGAEAEAIDQERQRLHGELLGPEREGAGWPGS